MAEPETDKRPEGEEPAAAAGEIPARTLDAAKGHPSSRPAAAAKAAPSTPPPAAPPAPPALPPAPEPADEAVTAAQVPPAVAAAFPPSARTSVASVRTPDAGGPLGAYEAIARSARLPDLVAIAQKILGDAAVARPAGWDFAAKVAAAADDAKLSAIDADTPFGNVLKVLGSGAEGLPERSLAAALWAHAIAEARRDDEHRLAGDILWLATHTAFDATPLLDRALGEESSEVWTAIGDLVRRVDDGKGGALGRGEAIVGCAALAASESAVARKVTADLASRLHDPTLVRLVRLVGAPAPAPARELRLEGEAMAPPRGRFLTGVLALTGILFVMHALRLVARLALAYRRPAEVTLSETGIRMRTRTEMLGRTLREREHVIVRAGLVRIVREVRYPRAGFYAGLLALAVGSYVGVRAFVDGVRAASPSLLATGLAVVALGIAADFVLGSLLPGTKGRVRIAFIPRTGKALCLADVDAARADAALASALGSR